MTIKEIAELCGATERTIRRWAHKIADDNLISYGQNVRKKSEDFVQNAQGSTEKLADNLVQNAEGLPDDPVQNEQVFGRDFWLGILEKLDQGSPENPSDYDLDETLAIIGEGGGNKALASLLRDNATYKHAIEASRPKDYGKRIKPAGHAANKVNKLMEKYRHTDKIAKADAKSLFQHAAALRRYFYDTAMVNDTLVIQHESLQRKVDVLEQRLGITDEAADEMVFALREKISRKDWWALGENIGRKQIAAPIPFPRNQTG
jgi:hypothetical protein